MVERADQMNSQGVQYYEAGNYAAAMQYFLESMRLGGLEAQYNLGLLYMHGKGIPADFGKAMKLFADYIDKEGAWTAEAIYNCAYMYEYGGVGVRCDRNKAVQLYEVSADMGFAKAQLMLGKMLQLSGQYDKARISIQHAMANAPDNYEIQNVGKKLLRANKLLRW